MLAPHKRLTDERKQNWQPQNKWKTEKCHVRVQAQGCPIFTLIIIIIIIIIIIGRTW